MAEPVKVHTVLYLSVCTEQPFSIEHWKNVTKSIYLHYLKQIWMTCNMMNDVSATSLPHSPVSAYVTCECVNQVSLIFSENWIVFYGKMLSGFPSDHLLCLSSLWFTEFPKGSLRLRGGFQRNQFQQPLQTSWQSWQRGRRKEKKVWKKTVIERETKDKSGCSHWWQPRLMKKAKRQTTSWTCCLCCCTCSMCAKLSTLKASQANSAEV